VGTASLIFGLILIGMGIFVFIRPGETEFPWIFLMGKLIVGIPLFAIGGLFLWKYDRDRKKEKNS